MGAQGEKAVRGAGAPTGRQGAVQADGAAGVAPGAFWCCLVAGALGTVETLLFNGELFDVYEGVVSWTRDGATLLEAVLLLGLMLAARLRPRSLRPVALTVAAAALSLAGHVLGAVGVACASPAAVVAGIGLGSVCSVWGTAAWLLACSTLGMRRACLCLAASGVVAVPIAFAVNRFAPYVLLNAVDFACSAGLAAFSLRSARPVFDRLAVVATPAEQAVLNPRAFLPLGHAFYVFIFGFSLAYGFALRCEGITGSGMVSGAMMAVSAAVAVYAWRVKGQPRADVLFSVAFLLVAAGFMLVLVDDARTETFAAALLVAGYGCQQLLVWFALCAAASRNAVDALPVVCWGTAVGYAGICCGAWLWIVPNLLLEPVLGDTSLLQGLVVTAVFCALLLYMLVTRRTFSFDATIEGIAPDAPQVEVRYVDVLDDQCEAAAGAFGLTAREAEVMRLLAHGNNTARIQEELGIGGNTVKYHVKNVYAKLGVHSQQQLIDLVARG